MRLCANAWYALPVLLASACGSDPAQVPPWDGLGGPGNLDSGAGLGTDAGGQLHGDANAPNWNWTGNDQDGGTGSLTEDSACAASSVAAEEVVVTEEVEVEVEVEVPAPVALYVMFDKSLSMSPNWGNTGDLWTPAVTAIKAFANSSASEGTDMALQYFPKSGGSCSTGSGYSTPAVALGRLPGHADAIADSLDDETPNGYGTPIEGALRGATEYCKTFQASHAEERCVAVLVTDGKPEHASGCTEDDDKLAAIAASAWNDHGVRTFAVGLSGADFSLLDKIAQAGGAADCDPGSSRFSCDVSSGADKLADALAKIRDTVTTVEVHTETQTRTEQRPLECEWQMPEPSADETLDPGQVNVTVSGGGSSALDLGRVPTAAECRDGAWHYDAPDAPQRIIACPETCDAIKAAGHTDVKILLGCETRVFVF